MTIQYPFMETADFDEAIVAHRARHVPPFRAETMRAGRRLPVVAGGWTAFELRIPVPRGMTLVRAPAGVDGVGRVLPFSDGRPQLAHPVAGVYVVRHALGPYVRDLVAVALAREAFLALGPAHSNFDHGLTMAAVLNDPRATVETIVAALEGDERPTGLPQLYGASEGIDVARFRCGEPVNG